MAHGSANKAFISGMLFMIGLIIVFSFGGKMRIVGLVMLGAGIAAGVLAFARLRR